MNWTQRPFINNTHYKNLVDSGVKVLVKKNNPHPFDVNDESDECLYEIFTSLDIDSLYHVGFSMGHHLINFKRLRPKVKIAGCDLSDMSRAFSNNLFGLNDYGFDLLIKEYPYFDIKEYDLIFLGNIVDKCNLCHEILRKAIEDTKLYVLFKTVNINRYNFPDSCSVEEINGWTLISKISVDTTGVPNKEPIEITVDMSISEDKDKVDYFSSNSAENQFLKKNGFTREDGSLINKDNETWRDRPIISSGEFYNRTTDITKYYEEDQNETV